MKIIDNTKEDDTTRLEDIPVGAVFRCVPLFGQHVVLKTKDFIVSLTNPTLTYNHKYGADLKFSINKYNATLTLDKI